MQDFIVFDLVIVAEHTLLVWAGSLTLNAVNAFPPKYCDVLHRTAKHLGCWDCVGSNGINNVLSLSCVE